MKSVWIILLVVFFSTGVFSQQVFHSIQITSSPNPVGSGARAQGMGGAFIAVADDATAASWNPGGLMQLETPEISIVGSFINRGKEFDSSSHPEIEATHGITRFDINYLSCAYPFRAFNKNMIVSLNYQRLYEFYDNIKFHYNYTGTLSDGSPYFVKSYTKFYQEGALKAFAPAFAIQVTPRFSVGITFNVWTDNLGYHNRWESIRVTDYVAHVKVPGRQIKTFFGKEVFKEENSNFEGFNINVGFLWQITQKITISGVFKTPFTADFHRQTYAYQIAYPLHKKPPRIKPFVSSEHVELHFPMSYGVGIAYRFSDAFTVAFDIYRTRWSRFWMREQDGRRICPITGKLARHSHIHDTTQIRIGCEYLFILERTLIPLRFGIFYDPEPSEKNPEDFYGVSLGTGIMIGDAVLDIAYIYRFGRDVKEEVVGASKIEADIDQHMLLFSMIYHF